MKKQRVLAGALALCLPFVSACFDIEQAVKLNKDLSGEAGVSIRMNMEPIALVLLGMQGETSGRSGDPAARIRGRAGSRRTWTTHRFPPRALIEHNLPPGVKLLDTEISDEDMGMSGRFSVAFDNVSKLSQIRVPEAAGMVKDVKTPFERPFPFDIKDEGSTLLLTMEPMDPMGNQKPQTEEMMLPPVLQQQMDAAFAGRRIAFRLETPLSVVEHNATRTAGRTLYWDYDPKTLEKMTPEQRAQGVRVRLKKS